MGSSRRRFSEYSRLPLMTILASLAAFATAGGALAQSAGNNAGNFIWLNANQAACMNRATQAVQGANGAFNLRSPVDRFDGWIVSVRNNDLYIAVHCVADDETPAIVSANARRVLVVIQVETRIASLDAQLRPYLQNCMVSGACGGPARGGVARGGNGPPGAGFNDYMGSRLAALQGRLSRDDYARLYADLSVLIAGYGRRVGWLDGQDPYGPPGDQGRGVTDWNGHYRYGLNDNGTIPGFVSGRLATLRGSLPGDLYARLEGDIARMLSQRGG